MKSSFVHIKTATREGITRKLFRLSYLLSKLLRINQSLDLLSFYLIFQYCQSATIFCIENMNSSVSDGNAFSPAQSQNLHGTNENPSEICLPQMVMNPSLEKNWTLLTSMVSFRSVFKAHDADGKLAVIKVFAHTNYEEEIEVHRKLLAIHHANQSTSGDSSHLNRPRLPQIYDYGLYDKEHAIVMELLGPSVWQTGKPNLSMPKAISLGLKMFRRIYEMHKAGFIHGDVAPRNFVHGLPDSEFEEEVFVIDFGLSTSVQFEKFISIRSGELRCNERHSRRNDLKRIFVSIQLFQGADYNQQDWADKYPLEFQIILNIVSNLKPYETPCYKYLERLFEVALFKANQSNHVSQGH